MDYRSTEAHLVGILVWNCGLGPPTLNYIVEFSPQFIYVVVCGAREIGAREIGAREKRGNGLSID